MQLNFPAPFNASNNPFRTTASDPYLQYPYDCCGPNNRWTYPCRGYLSLLGTPQGAPTATWQAGSVQSWNISGIGNHYGGSCQVGFSVDGGETFRVATSYEGNCPHREGGDGPGGQDFPFRVPGDLKAGVQVFAWVWYNREQEFNMNCAAVNITEPSTSIEMLGQYGNGAPASTPSSHPTASPSAASTAASQMTFMTANNCTCICASPVNISTCDCSCPVATPPPPHSARDLHQHIHHKRTLSDKTAPSSAPQTTSPKFTPFDSRPQMLIADNGNGCLTPKSTAEVKYPDPGPDVVTGDGVYPLELPSGNCGSPGLQAYDGADGEDGHKP